VLVAAILGPKTNSCKQMLWEMGGGGGGGMNLCLIYKPRGGWAMGLGRTPFPTPVFPNLSPFRYIPPVRTDSCVLHLTLELNLS